VIEKREKGGKKEKKGEKGLRHFFVLGKLVDLDTELKLRGRGEEERGKKKKKEKKKKKKREVSAHVFSIFTSCSLGAARWKENEKKKKKKREKGKKKEKGKKSDPIFLRGTRTFPRTVARRWKKEGGKRK